MAFDPNNYQVKYYKLFRNQRGELVHLEIREKVESLPSDYPMEIGDLCGLNLTIDGRAEAIDVPIVKTTLTFSMVDTADEGLEYNPDGYYIKHGDWQEFYTPDATKYLVIVSTAGSARWSGFITPDSWEESLAYRGIITITARDNIGALSELPFDMAADANGMICVRDLIDAAFDKVDIPMEIFNGVDYPRYDYRLQDENGNSPLDLLVNRAVFNDKTWYEALEETLNSLGLAMRFSDDNGFALVPMRYIPRLNFTEDDGQLEDIELHVQFHNGNKILDPAYKTITERIRFGFSSDIEFSGEDSEITFQSDVYPTYHMIHQYYRSTSQFLYLAMDAALHASVDSGADKAWDTDGYPCFLDVSRYEIDDDSFNLEGDDVKKYIFAAANSSDPNSRKPSFKKRLASTNCKLVLDFAENPATLYNTTATNDWSGATAKLRIMTQCRAYKIKLLIRYQNYRTNPGITRWWDGYSWVATQQTESITKEWNVFTEAGSSIEVDLADCENIKNGYLVVQIVSAEYRMYYKPDSTAELEKCRGLFMRIKGVRFDSVVKRSVGEHTTTTNNSLNTACNVRLERNPLVGFLPQKVGMLFSENYLFAFFQNNNGVIEQAPYQWRWQQGEALEPFPVLVAKQILCYHATSEAILEGDFSPIDNYPARFHRIFMYKGYQYIFQGGTLDFRTGRFTSATLRGFEVYEDIFND